MSNWINMQGRLINLDNVTDIRSHKNRIYFELSAAAAVNNKYDQLEVEQSCISIQFGDVNEAVKAMDDLCNRLQHSGGSAL